MLFAGIIDLQESIDRGEGSAAPDETMEAVGAIYASREGPMWQPLVNKFSAEHGQRLLGQRWRPRGLRERAGTWLPSAVSSSNPYFFSAQRPDFP